MIKKLITEFIGTFFLVLAIAMTGNPIAIGAMLVVMVYMGGHISGAHYNPAVSFGVMLLGRACLKDTILYWIAQILGAFAAAGVAWWLTDVLLEVTPSELVGSLQAVVIEAIFTFALVLVIFNVAVSSKTQGNSYYGLAIGFTVLAAAFAGGPLSGGAFNPAVGLGPLLFDLLQGGSNPFRRIYLVGPMIGAAFATGVYGLQESE